MTTPTVKTLAAELSAMLTTKERSNGGKFTTLKDGRPDWMQDVVRACHAGMLPDDTIYHVVEQCADAIAEASDDTDPADAISDIESDVYTSDLTAWLNASPNHVYYLTEVLEECGDIRDGFQLLALAQLAQIREVGAFLVDALESRVREVQA